MITNLLNRIADILANRILEAIEVLQGEQADKDAITCDRRCGKRRTKNEHSRNQLLSIGLYAFKEELGKSKDEPSTDNQQAVEESNVEAADSVKDKEPDELTKLADSLKDGDRVPVGMPNTNPYRESTKKACEDFIGIKND